MSAALWAGLTFSFIMAGLWLDENWKEGSTRYEGQANYTVVDVDGALRIGNHYWAGLRTFSTG